MTDRMPSAFQSVWAAVGDPLVVVDRDQRIVMFNPAAESMFGYTAAEILGQSLSVLLPERFRDPHRGQAKEFHTNGAGHTVPAAHRPRVLGRRKNGAEFPAEITLATIEIGDEPMSTATVRDVSDRVSAERALAESERRFRVVFEHSPIPIALVGLDRRFLGANRAFSEMTGYALSDIEGMAVSDLVEAEDLSEIDEAIGTLISGSTRSARLQIRQRNASGDAHIVDLNLAVALDEHGAPLHVIGQALQITDRIEARQRLEETIRSKDELIASISHELRTPLTAVSGFAQVLLEDPESLTPEERDELTRLVVGASSEMTNIVEDLLVAARADIGTLSVVRVPLDLGEEARQVLRAWPGSEAASVDVTGDPVDVIGDPARIRQILRNLISNALRYGTPPVSIRTVARVEMASICVCDAGDPISGEDRERIFERFERAHHAEGVPASIGLGLAISRDLARLMDGDLVYRREADRNVFELTLPRADPTST